MTHRALLAAGLGLALAGCSGSSTPTPSSPAPSNTQPVEPATAVPSERPSEAPPALDDGSLRAVGRGVNGLGADLFARLATAPGNITFSPASVEAALAMTAAGARGATRDEMTRVLHLEGDADAAIDGLGATLRTWDDPAQTERTLRVANRLFGERTYTFEETFVARVRDRFAAPLEGLDFRSASEAARTQINGWVSTHTHDRIRDLLPAGSIDPSTRLVLVNAVYFDARWESPFERTATHDAAFTTEGGAAVQVPTMHRRGSYAVGQIGGATVVELGYRGGDMAMWLVLPPAGTAPEAWATEANLAADASALTPRQILLAVPSFRIEPEAPVALRPHLEALGMRAAFSSTDADFTGIAAPPDPADRLFVSAVFHKAFVRVDEAGTEAAAATAVVMARAGAAMPVEMEEIHVDRPFLFVLRDRRTGAALFLGRVSDPR